MSELLLQEIAGIASTPHATASHIQLSSTMLLRSAGLPLNAVAMLEAPDVVSAIDALLGIDSILSQKADILSELLHAEIGQLQGDQASQRVLLNLRRSIFNRRPLAPAAMQQSLALLSDEAVREVTDWESLRTERERFCEAGEKAMAASADEARVGLQQLAAEPLLRRALALSNPSLHRPLEQYASAKPGSLDRKLRRAERTLLTYLLRAVFKTSPFSTLTSVAMVQLEEDAHAAVAVPRNVVCKTRPHIGILALVEQAISRNAFQYPFLPMQLQPDAVVEGNRVRFWRRSEKLNNAYGPIYSEVSEYFFWLQLTPSLRRVMALLQAGPQNIHSVLACIEASGLNAEAAQEYMRLLLSSGLLIVSGLRQSVHNPSLWTDTIKLLRANNDLVLNAVADHLEELLARTADFATAGITERLRILAEFDSSTDVFLERLGSEGKAPRPTIYEDASFCSTPLVLKRERWEPFVEPLAEIQRLSALYDPFLVPRVTFRSLFKRRFGVGGRCNDILEMSDYYHEVFYGPYSHARNGRNPFRDQLGSGSLNPLRVGEVQNILDAQTVLAAQLRDLLAQNAGAEEISIPPHWITDFGGLAARQYKVFANSFFVQSAENSCGDPLLVLNHLYAGFGCMLSRFCYMFDSEQQGAGGYLHEALSRSATSHDTNDTVYAEFQGGHQTNLNQHPVVTQYEIVCPGENGTRPAEQQIQLGELSLVHDAATDEVFVVCDRIGKRVVPLYLGMMYPLAVPNLQKTLLLFSPPPIMGPSSDTDDVQPTGDEVIYHPRLRHRNVVLQRASWDCTIAAFPLRERDATDFQYLLAVSRWKSTRNLPDRSYVTISETLATPSAGGSEGESTGGVIDASKPCFLDFRLPSCVLLLEKMAAGKTGTLRFTEALPLPEDAPFSTDGNQHVSEFVLEIHQELAQ